MTTATARAGEGTRSPDLLAGYLAHVDGLELSDRARRGRRVAAARFLQTFPDVAAWMARPTAARVVDLRRSGAWPLLVFAIAGGHVRLDLELAGVKHLAGLGTAIRAADPAGFARAEAAGLQLGGGRPGSTPSWRSAWPCSWPAPDGASTSSTTPTSTGSTPIWHP